MFTTSAIRTGVGVTAIVLLAASPALALGPILRTAAQLTDVAPAAAGPFDGASARVQLVESARGSHAVLTVTGIAPSAEGGTFGAHLHDGPCVAGDGAAAGPHYNAHVHGQTETAGVNDRTEIWLDFRVEDGSGTGTASVPFVPEPGRRSVVVHAAPTNPETGGAGARLACLTVDWR